MTGSSTSPRKLAQLQPPELPRRSRLGADDFLRQYYAANRPVIITDMLDDYAARQHWSLDWLAARFGERTVEVQCGRNADDDYELNSIAHKRAMRFADYIALLQAQGHSNDFYMTANNHSRNRTALAELWDDVPQLPEYLATRADGRGRRFPLVRSCGHHHALPP